MSRPPAFPLMSALALLCTAACNDAPTAPLRAKSDAAASLGPTVPGAPNCVLCGTNNMFVVARTFPGSWVTSIALMSTNGLLIRRLTDDNRSASYPALSPDRKKAAFVWYRDWAEPGVPNVVDDRIFLVNVDGTGVTHVARMRDIASAPAWSPDGKRLVFQRTRIYSSPEPDPDGVWMMNVDGTGLTKLPQSEGGTSPAFTSDGTTVYYARSYNTPTPGSVDSTQRGEVVFHSLATGLKWKVAPEFEGAVTSPTLAPDGKHLVFVRTLAKQILRCEVVRVDLPSMAMQVMAGYSAPSPTGFVPPKLPTPRCPHSVSFSLDGAWILGQGWTTSRHALWRMFATSPFLMVEVAPGQNTESTPRWGL